MGVGEAQVVPYTSRANANYRALPLPLQPSFLDHYGRIAVRKLLFFHGKNGSIRTRDLVNSIVLQVGSGERAGVLRRGAAMCVEPPKDGRLAAQESVYAKHRPQRTSAV